MHFNPSIKPASYFNATSDAEELHKAFKGIGCNKSKVIQILCGRSNSQRQEIAHVYKPKYGKDLLKELKSELSGDFEDLILALMETPLNYDAQQLHKAIAGVGTNENALIEILTTRSNAQIHELKHAYKHNYGKELEADIVGDTSGHFQRLLVQLVNESRDEGHHTDHEKANHDARKLLRAGELRLGTDNDAFLSVLATQNYSQLHLVFEEYQKITAHQIEHAIKEEFSGDLQQGLLAIIKRIRSQTAYFAEQLHNSMKGLGTRDQDLIRLVVSRAEIDLVDIRNEYRCLTGKSLEDDIKGDCSGAYKDGLIALVKGN